jgi:hypothetical protein
MYVVLQRALNKAGKVIGVYMVDGSFWKLSRLRNLNMNKFELLIGEDFVDSQQYDFVDVNGFLSNLTGRLAPKCFL